MPPNIRETNFYNIWKDNFFLTVQYVWRKRIILTVCKLLLPRYFIINFLGPKYGHYVEDAVRRVLYLIMVIRTALLERTTVQEKVVQDRERY